MFNRFRKKKKAAKSIGLPPLDGAQGKANDPNFSNTGFYGPSIPLEGVPEDKWAYRSHFGHWKALGGAAWNVLSENRIKDIFPDCDNDEGCSEFLLYWELIHRSSELYKNEIFVGLGAHPEAPAPRFVPRSTFDGHAYILGKTARGKTSQALSTLLLQLGCPANSETEFPALLIIDLKPQGDRFLRAVAELVAQKNGQKFRFFSNAYRYESLLFDPWSSISSQHDVQAKAETIFKGLSLIHPESQDSVFFMNEQRHVLEKALASKPPPKSLRDLISRLEEMTRGNKGNREARGIHGALSIFEHSVNVLIDEPQPGRTDVIDFRTLLDNREVLYVHLESDEKHLSSQATGKLIISSLLTAAKQRREDDGLKAAKVYVAIDEFHRLAAQNVVSFLETSRDIGVSFILSHQSPQSLRSANDDLFRLLFDITSFQQYLTLTNELAIELLRLVSSRRSELLRQTGRGTSHTDGTSTGWSRDRSSGISGSYSWSPFGGAESERVTRGWSESEGHGVSGGTSHSEGVEESSGETETKIPGLTPEMIARMDDPDERASLIVSWGEEDSKISPFRGVPTLVHRIFPFSKGLAKKFRADAWPLRGAPSPPPGGQPERPLYFPKPKEEEPKSLEDVTRGVFSAAKDAAKGRPKSRPKKKGPKKTKDS